MNPSTRSLVRRWAVRSLAASAILVQLAIASPPPSQPPGNEPHPPAGRGQAGAGQQKCDCRELERTAEEKQLAADQAQRALADAQSDLNQADRLDKLAAAEAAHAAHLFQQASDYLTLDHQAADKAAAATNPASKAAWTQIAIDDLKQHDSIEQAAQDAQAEANRISAEASALRAKVAAEKADAEAKAKAAAAAWEAYRACRAGQQQACSEPKTTLQGAGARTAEGVAAIETGVVSRTRGADQAQSCDRAIEELREDDQNAADALAGVRQAEFNPGGSPLTPAEQQSAAEEAIRRAQRADAEAKARAEDDARKCAGEEATSTTGATTGTAGGTGTSTATGGKSASRHEGNNDGGANSEFGKALKILFCGEGANPEAGRQEGAPQSSPSPAPQPKSGPSSEPAQPPQDNGEARGESSSMPPNADDGSVIFGTVTGTPVVNIASVDQTGKRSTAQVATDAAGHFACAVSAGTSVVEAFTGLDPSGAPRHLARTVIGKSSHLPGTEPLPTSQIPSRGPTILEGHTAMERGGTTTLHTGGILDPRTTRVLMDQKPLETLAASDSSVVARVPSDTALGMHTVGLSSDGAESNQFSTAVVTVVPEPIKPMHTGSGQKVTWHIQGLEALPQGASAFLHVEVSGSARLRSGAPSTDARVKGGVATADIQATHAGGLVVTYWLWIQGLWR
jgi:hypothetical protein